METSLTVPLGNLGADRVYEIVVTAIPENGTEADGQTASLRFARAPEPVGEVSAPQIAVSPVSYEDGGVQYLDSDATFTWSAEGDVAGYRVIMRDANTTYVDQQTARRR